LAFASTSKHEGHPDITENKKFVIESVATAKMIKGYLFVIIAETGSHRSMKAKEKHK
jgi:hypothetical protein